MLYLPAHSGCKVSRPTKIPLAMILLDVRKTDAQAHTVHGMHQIGVCVAFSSEIKQHQSML